VKFYAGVGARDTPPEILMWMKAAAQAFKADGWTLRSGHAEGADMAFEEGADGAAQIFLPWPTYNNETPVRGWRMDRPDARAFEIAQEHHPNWYTMGSGGRALHARNCHQVLGQHLVDPVTFVLCWTESGHRKGGTATTIRLAESRRIKVFNLWHAQVQERIEGMVSDYLDTIC
jgi:hypothetical protein